MSRATDLFDLTGRVAIITGGSRGIGLQMAEALGDCGAAVVLTARKADELASARSHLEARGIRVETVACDLSQAGSASKVVDTALAINGRIDILVNNAGNTWGAPAESFPDEAWRKVMALNVDAAFALTRETAARAMLPQGYGRIVNIASILGMFGNLVGMPATSVYNTSKAAVIGMTRALASEWGARGITVNAIAPGYFASKMTKGTLDLHEERLLSNTPRGQLGGEEDLKGPILLLASDAGAHITGQVLAVDGGMTAI